MKSSLLYFVEFNLMVLFEADHANVKDIWCQISVFFFIVVWMLGTFSKQLF